MSREQLLAAGISRRQIETRLRDGRLIEIHRGVYLVGAVAGEHTHAMAALLACGEKCVLSHRSAASLWNLLPYPATAPVWVTVPPDRKATRPRIKTLRARLASQDIRKRHGMPLTSPPRVVFELAPHLLFEDLETLVAEANFRRLANEAELRDQLERNRGARGSRAMRRVLDLPEGPKRTRSPAERLLLRLLRANSVTGFETNTSVLGYVVDFFWPSERLVVEVHGWDGHSGRTAFERDRLKWGTPQRFRAPGHARYGPPAPPRPDGGDRAHRRGPRRDPSAGFSRLRRLNAALDRRSGRTAA